MDGINLGSIFKNKRKEKEITRMYSEMIRLI